MHAQEINHSNNVCKVCVNIFPQAVLKNPSLCYLHLMLTLSPLSVVQVLHWPKSTDFNRFAPGYHLSVNVVLHLACDIKLLSPCKASYPQGF